MNKTKEDRIKKIAKIIKMNLEDSDNYPSIEAFAEATAHTICEIDE